MKESLIDMRDCLFVVFISFVSCFVVLLIDWLMVDENTVVILFLGL